MLKRNMRQGSMYRTSRDKHQGFYTYSIASSLLFLWNFWVCDWMDLWFLCFLHSFLYVGLSCPNLIWCFCVLSHYILFCNIWRKGKRGGRKEWSTMVKFKNRTVILPPGREKNKFAPVEWKWVYLPFQDGSHVHE